MKRQLQLAQIKSELLCCASHNIESVQCLTTSNTKFHYIYSTLYSSEIHLEPSFKRFAYFQEGLSMLEGMEMRLKMQKYKIQRRRGGDAWLQWWDSKVGEAAAGSCSNPAHFVEPTNTKKYTKLQIQIQNYKYNITNTKIQWECSNLANFELTLDERALHRAF